MAKPDENGATPMLNQYFDICAKHPGYIVFYRAGDFYEMFFEDAKTVSQALGLALTKRGTYKGEPVPMCGVPFHSYEPYLSRLIKLGFKVAICEQMEDPSEAKKRGSNAIVKREVVRLVTAGTLTEDNLLDARRNNFVVCLANINDSLGISWLDLSTGDFFTEEIASSSSSELKSRLSSTLTMVNPSEIIVADRYIANPRHYDMLTDYKHILSVLPQARFNFDNALKRMLELYQVQTLEVFGDFSKAEISAAGVLIDYVENTQKGLAPSIRKPIRMTRSQVMEMDAATRINLEILESNSKISKSSLLNVIDCTVSGAGARMLRSRIAAPLTDIDEINKRLNVIEFFIGEPIMRGKIKNLLSSMCDIERILSRLQLQRATPIDMQNLTATLLILSKFRNTVYGRLESMLKSLPQEIEEIVERVETFGDLTYKLLKAFDQNADLPASTRAGGFIASGYSLSLDSLRELKENGHTMITELQQKYVKETGISGLKIKYNNLIGYFVEVPLKHGEEMIKFPDFVHRQALVNALRYTTAELSEIENKIRSSSEKALNLELELFNELANEVKNSSKQLLSTAKALAEFDVGVAMAQLAVEKKYCRPVVDNSLDFEITKGRHPVVETTLFEETGGSFVGNDCNLKGNKDNIWLITGPNMAGKSTFMRQNALIAVMAQTGIYVPAEKAHIGVVSKLFSRIGASDDLARGRSTFMVEMVETSSILNRADDRSLVILDEIGRGTATFDGLSIAWAVIEHLFEINRCRVLFATHYHELTTLA